MNATHIMSLVVTMKKAVIVCLALFSVATSVLAEKLAEFEVPFEGVRLAMDNDRLYIADYSEGVIHIYSRRDYTQIGQFGRKGQGPTDFESIRFIRVYPEFVYISDGRKIAYYTKDGQFMKTQTLFPNSGGYIPLGRNFVCKTYLSSDPREERTKIQVELLDKDFSKKGVLYASNLRKFARHNFQTGKTDVLMVRDCFKFDVQNDKLIVGDTDVGCFFVVFDANGKKLYEINLPFEKRKIGSKDKDQLIEGERRSFGDQRYNAWKAMNEWVFPRFYPAYSDFAVADSKIYVFSYPIENQPQKITILDLKGNVLRKTTIAEVSYAYVISQGTYYYLKYNDDTYKWELHRTRID